MFGNKFFKIVRRKCRVREQPTKEYSGKSKGFLSFLLDFKEKGAGAGSPLLEQKVTIRVKPSNSYGGAVISCPYCSSSPSVRLFGPLVEEIRSHPVRATEWTYDQQCWFTWPSGSSVLLRQRYPLVSPSRNPSSSY